MQRNMHGNRKGTKLMLTTLFDKLISWAHVPTAQAIRLSSFSACLGTCAYHSYKDFVYAHN